jgi:hypothetical protein
VATPQENLNKQVRIVSDLIIWKEKQVIIFSSPKTNIFRIKNFFKFTENMKTGDLFLAKVRVTINEFWSPLLGPAFALLRMR